MSILPRLAVGTIQPEADAQAIIWAVLDAIGQKGLQVQTFLSRACFAAHDGAATITGNTPHHLDSWLLSAELCEEVFLRNAAAAQLALVEGQYDQAATGWRGGSLDTLCAWLDLPKIAIVDTPLLQDCCLPQRPVADALVLDLVSSISDLYRWQTVLESLWGIPVVGALGMCMRQRAEIAQLAPGQKPPRELCRTLGDAYRSLSDVDRLLSYAARGGITQYAALSDPADTPAHHATGKVRVAVAYDDAFHCYFPDVFDMLELSGATMRVFSPLRDECLPHDTDIVYLGCGHPERHATALAENHCMLMALKEHICAGRRVYAEGGGLAYLCQHIELADGRLAPMVGVIRAIARRNPVPTPPDPVELTLAVDSWLGAAGSRVRGYRNQNWLLTPTGSLTHYVADAEHELDLVGRHQVIGSRVHLNFAAQPELLSGFLRPCPAALAWSGTK